MATKDDRAVNPWRRPIYDSQHSDCLSPTLPIPKMVPSGPRFTSFPSGNSFGNNSSSVVLTPLYGNGFELIEGHVRNLVCLCNAHVTPNIRSVLACSKHLQPIFKTFLFVLHRLQVERGRRVFEQSNRTIPEAAAFIVNVLVRSAQ